MIEGSPILALVIFAIFVLTVSIIIARQTSSYDHPGPWRVGLVGAIIVGLAAGISAAYLINAGWAN